MNNDQSIKNVTDLRNIPIGELTNYPTKKLYLLLKSAIESYDLAKKNKEWLEAAISLKFDESFSKQRIRQARETGIIHIIDGNYQISSDIPKRIEWDQKLLIEIAEELKSKGTDPKEYIEISYNIQESKYKSWTLEEKQIFMPARTLKFGKAKYSLSIINQNNKGGK